MSARRLDPIYVARIPCRSIRRDGRFTRFTELVSVEFFRRYSFVQAEIDGCDLILVRRSLQNQFSLRYV